jgi:hypothetical protein
LAEFCFRIWLLPELGHFSPALRVNLSETSFAFVFRFAVAGGIRWDVCRTGEPGACESLYDVGTFWFETDKADDSKLVGWSKDRKLAHRERVQDK